MSIDREKVDAALLKKLTDKLDPSLFTLIGRKHIMPPTLQPEQQPALFPVGLGEHKTPGPRGFPGKVTLTYSLFLYAYDNAGDQTAGQETDLLATKLNQLKGAIEDALDPDTGDQTQTLGQTVSHCWIEGETFQDPGIFGKQGFAVIPVKILVP